jgi:hypothetical protein
MRKSITILPVVISVMMLALTACGNSSSPSKSSTQNTVFTVSDASANMRAVSEVEITIDQVRVRSTAEAWITVSNQTKTFELIELNGSAQLLAETNLSAGTYDRVELDISKVVVVDNTGEHEAKLPSNKLQIACTLNITANNTSATEFDFLANESLHVTGNGRYILAPVIHLETRSGAIAEISSDSNVKINGGTTTANIEVGMDINGDIGVGLNISPDAVLDISSDNTVVQSSGQAMAVGTIKAVDIAAGIVTISIAGGQDIVLEVTSSTEIKISNAISTMVTLASNIGSEVNIKYEASTNVATEIKVGY